MSAKTLKVGGNTVDDRTDEERERAQPVELAAGSYDAEKLQSDLDTAALKKSDGKRPELIAKAVDKLNESPFKPSTLGLNPGEKRVTVEDESLGITEERVVFDPDKREEQEEAIETAPKAIDPSKQPVDDSAGNKE